MSDHDDFDDDDFEDEVGAEGNRIDNDVDDDDDEVGAEGNRIVGARAQETVEFIARSLVDDPDGVFVDPSEQRGGVTLLVHASPGDLGRLIGRRGRVIQAVRQLARVAGATEDVRVTVDVAD